MSFDDPTFSCGDPDFEYGETEDYCVEIAGASSIKSNVDIDISLYPNPAHQFLEAKNLFYEGQVSIYDLNGREILSQPILPKNSYKIELPESMSNGLYLFVYEADGKSWNKKFIKH